MKKQQKKLIQCEKCRKWFTAYSLQTHKCINESETPIYNRAYVDRLFRDGMNDY